MKIKKISMYQVDVPLVEKEAGEISGGRVYHTLDSTIVCVENDEGTKGWGETIPYGSNWSESYPEGVRAGLSVLAPKLIGMDPVNIGKINHFMDKELISNVFAKAPIDIALWDMFGKTVGRPLYDLLGGKLTQKPQQTMFLDRNMGPNILEEIEQYRKWGTLHFTTKGVGSIGHIVDYLNFVAQHMNTDEYLHVDFCSGLRFDEALTIARRIEGINVFFEQPCKTIDECMKVQEVTGIPVMLDESLLKIEDLIYAISNYPVPMINLKISKVGGITKAKQIIDLCKVYGIPIAMQDISGTQIATAACIHMAHTVPEELLESAWSMQTLVGIETATGSPQVIDGRSEASTRSGLGIEVNLDVLGEPVAVWE